MDEKVAVNCKGLGDLSGDKSPVNMYDGIMQSSDKMQNSPTVYTMPGVLNFLQSEWAKMKFERGQWEIERAELQARIAFLQGERKGQENLKQDLVRRIKMLEYALKQERLKLQRWKHGETGSKELEENGKPSDGESEEPEHDLAAILEKTTKQVAASNAKWKESRTKLRQYLQEVGFTDNVVDARQARLREVMSGVSSQISYSQPEDGFMNGEYFNRKTDGTPLDVVPVLGGQGRGAEIRRLREATNNSSEAVRVDGVDDEEAENRSVLDNFNFLSNEVPATSDEEEESALEEFDILVSHDTPSSPKVKVDHEASDVMDFESQEDEEYDAIEWTSPETLMRKLKAGRGAGKRATLRSMLASLNTGEDEPEAAIEDRTYVETLNESPESTEDTTEDSSDATDTVGRKKPSLSSPPHGWQHMLGLGDLASLTVANEAEDESRLRDANSDRPVPSSPNAVKVRRTWSVRYALRSHFDAVRALTFHPSEPCMISASEDGTLKLWNIRMAPTGPSLSGKKASGGPGCDLEPYYTFRRHDSPVLCVRFTDDGRSAYSSDLNGNIVEWLIPERLTQATDPETGSTVAGVEEGVDLYEPFKMSMVHGRAWRASNSVWSIAVVGDSLISCAADGVIAVWYLARNSVDDETAPPQTTKMELELEDGVHATSLVCLPLSGEAEGAVPRALVGLSNGNVFLVDLQDKKSLLTLELEKEEESEDDGDALYAVNCIAVHPSNSNLVAVGYEDRHIRFFDVSDGRCIHSMVAHLDAVTCLDIDPTGLYLVSGSHDCSLRIWNFETRACIQEITSHRKKFDESIHTVAFHPSKALMSSGGADATTRVFIS